jgi:hypothetical protein
MNAYPLRSLVGLLDAQDRAMQKCPRVTADTDRCVVTEGAARRRGVGSADGHSR